MELLSIRTGRPILKKETLVQP